MMKTNSTQGRIGIIKLGLQGRIMPSVKKIKPLPSPLEREIAVDALTIFFFEKKFEELNKTSQVSDDIRRKYQAKFLELKETFQTKHRQYRHDFLVDFDHMTIIVATFFDWSNYLGLFRPKISPDEMYQRYLDLLKQSDTKPMKIGHKNEWAYKGFAYRIQGHYSDDEIRLLILEDFDKERRLFEKLKAKFDEAHTFESGYERPRIPENIRVEV